MQISDLFHQIFILFCTYTLYIFVKYIPQILTTSGVIVNDIVGLIFKFLFFIASI
jgi:hypothetical protein